MKNKDFKTIINQIKKYKLSEIFNNPKEFDVWLSKLNKKQIQNFNNLDIYPDEVKYIKELLINYELLNCKDYCRRVEAISKLKNGDGCYHLFGRLCSPNFLNSKNFYNDLDLIRKANTARYFLWIVNKDSFIKSKYHNEDLKLIIESKDIEESENRRDWLITEALATVAENKDSIDSPYHQEDMKLIANSGSSCLQMSHSYPEHSLNNLAINKISLNDIYHLENMQILSKNPIAREYLYNIMTNLDIIKGKNYREEVEALVNAKSKLNARAIYNYIVNPKNIRSYDFSEELYELGLNFRDIQLLRRNKNEKGNLNPRYVEYLNLLNQVDAKFVMFIESLISNKDLLNSKYYEEDLNLILKVTDKNIFMDLYLVMIDGNSLSSKHHRNDVNLISRTFDEKIRKLLLLKATDKYSLDSINHEYDMQYIAKLNLKEFDNEYYKKIYYYLFNHSGIDSIEHVDILEKIYMGEIIENYDSVLEHLDNLSNGKQTKNVKVLSKIKNILKK